MSQCIVPNWYLKQQRQEEQVLQAGGERNISSEVDHQLNPSNTSPMLRSKNEVTELTWENGQLAMHGIGGILPTTLTKSTCNDTLESIVRQATSTSTSASTSHNNKNSISLNFSPKSPILLPAETDLRGSFDVLGLLPGLLKKQTRADSEKCMQEKMGDRSASTACGSASATFCRDNETTMMIWPSYDSPRNFKTKTTDEDSGCHVGISENQDEDHQETKVEKGQSHSSRRSRAAAIHNQSERRRRDRINQKIKALQRLVPNANKTDKASMLEEVIDYLKRLQAQVQLMSSVRNVNNMSQMMMSLGLQQQQQQHHHQIQMSLLAARIGMGVGLGMGIGILDMNTIATAGRTAPQSLPSLIHPTAPVSATNPTFVPPPFIVPSMITQANPEHGDTNVPVPLTDPYCALLAQSMNVDLYNKMAAIYRQQVSQITQQAASSSPSTHSQSISKGIKEEEPRDLD